MQVKLLERPTCRTQGTMGRPCRGEIDGEMGVMDKWAVLPKPDYIGTRYFGLSHHTIISHAIEQ